MFSEDMDFESRLVTPEFTGTEDDSLELSLRPRALKDYLGQEKAKEFRAGAATRRNFRSRLRFLHLLSSLKCSCWVELFPILYHKSAPPWRLSRLEIHVVKRERTWKTALAPQCRKMV